MSYLKIITFKKACSQIDTYKKKIYIYGIATTTDEKDAVIEEANEILDVENVIASIFINEQGFDNAILINDAKEVTEFINGNIFIIQGNKITTPPLGSGCLDGVMRKHILIICNQLGFEAVESKISPFDLQKVDEIFMTNSISGVQGITDYRRTNYSTQTSELIQNELNNIVS